MKAIERKLNFGTRSLEDVFDATLGADISYWSIPDRKTCSVCGRRIDGRPVLRREGTGPVPSIPGGVRGLRALCEGRVTVPLCSPGCRQAYREWLRD